MIRELDPVQVDHQFGQFGDRGLDRVAEVHRPGDVVGGVHHSQEALDQIIHIAEGADLAAVAVERDRLALQRLDDESSTPRGRRSVHARPVGVEDPHHPDAQVVLAVIVEEQGLGASACLRRSRRAGRSG